MSTLLQDVRFGLRMLVKAPVVSTVAALSLALGIAANASIFAILNAFLFEPLPYRDQDGLVLMEEGPQGGAQELYGGMSVPNFRDLVAGAPSLADAMLYTVERSNLTGMDVPEQVNVVAGTPNLLEVLGVAPALGRGFRPEEGAEGRGSVVVLEHDFWQRRFLGDPDVLGRTVMLDGTVSTILGVLPESFDMIPANVDIFRPTDFEAQRGDRRTRGYLAFGRLAPGASIEQAAREVRRAWTDLAAAYPDANRGLDVRTLGLGDF
ncbi:MAG TPA: ABC transporter permease, partial [Longimicrobiales bacterium]|nr:ABC transporter permease [Longimicrobiales bacterium]